MDHDWLHPFRWITKVHYYIPDIAYYNFPYTFGALFSRGLYAMYEKEGQDFLPKYRALLKASTTNTVEDTAMAVSYTHLYQHILSIKNHHVQYLWM